MISDELRCEAAERWQEVQTAIQSGSPKLQNGVIDPVPLESILATGSVEGVRRGHCPLLAFTI